MITSGWARRRREPHRRPGTFRRRSGCSRREQPRRWLAPGAAIDQRTRVLPRGAGGRPRCRRWVSRLTIVREVRGTRPSPVAVLVGSGGGVVFVVVVVEVAPTSSDVPVTHSGRRWPWPRFPNSAEKYRLAPISLTIYHPRCALSWRLDANLVGGHLGGARTLTRGPCRPRGRASAPCVGDRT